MPHNDLNSVHTIEDAVSYWSGRFAAAREAKAKAAQHWTKVIPSNVSLSTGVERRRAIRNKDMSVLAAWCRRNQMEAAEGWSIQTIEKMREIERAETRESIFGKKDD